MDIPNQSSPIPEVWGGIECTINRVGDSFSDQLSFTTCYESDSYLDELAVTGIKALRFPVLWEKHQPEKDGDIHWEWAEAQLNKLRDRKIEPIAGLVHHGSGPAYTSLTDPGFPALLAAYAKQVALKFPWIMYYTPVNEPLTTARFSGLYGLWYPHQSDNHSFIRMLVNQLKGVVLAMQAIRSVNPDARLVQTEDLAKIHSTPLLRYQRDFENRRRWLSFDLLCGKVTSRHALWKFCVGAGITKEELGFFADNPCPPDVMGLNYYVTSERYLDENTALYPGSSHGGNGHHRYADVEAVRVKKPSGLKRLLREAWQRYRLPMAVTEVHIGCSREEQLRWFNEIWKQSVDAKKSGIDIRAVTTWSMLGSYDWNSLLTRRENHYEPGAFDTRNGNFRKTALVKLIAAAAHGIEYPHPLLQQDGWWKRPDRFYVPRQYKIKRGTRLTPPVLIAGKSGTLGSAFARVCAQRNIPFVLLSRNEMDITRETSIEKAINHYKPWALINAAGYVKVDEAEDDAANCFKLNAGGAEQLARGCRLHSIPFMTFSSDLVFNGDKKKPYTENDHAGPLNVYGQSKAYAEQLVTSTDPSALIIRSSSFFGPWDRYNFAYHLLGTLREGQVFSASQSVMSPTYIPDLVHAALDLLIDEERGIWHLCNESTVSWVDFAIQLALGAGYSTKKILSVHPEEMNLKAKRPVYSAMHSGKGIGLPALDHAINRFFRDRIV